ncbi:hypothetical protein CCACVL1_12522 [Corchorus capsularis]|uniref:Uncharacterized protein n=1 Tax=Corchorus capsularis TaxID=210143 RepID=A0A1R3IFB3_COCAP|nr:hypothetical protein CCACVL1_12522 [Corchorus capsularis]
MHRSASTSGINGRTADEFFVNMSPASNMVSPPHKAAAAASDDLPDHDDHQYNYNDAIIPQTTKKEIGLFHQHNISPGENAIHFIPMVLLLCFLTLWIFSRPVAPNSAP